MSPPPRPAFALTPRGAISSSSTRRARRGRSAMPRPWAGLPSIPRAGGAGGAPVTMVASNPKMDVVAAGFENGAIIVGQPGAPGAMPVLAPTGAAVTAMAWNPDGDRLLAGTEAGDVHIADFRV